MPGHGVTPSVLLRLSSSLRLESVPIILAFSQVSHEQRPGSAENAQPVVVVPFPPYRFRQFSSAVGRQSPVIPIDLVFHRPIESHSSFRPYQYAHTLSYQPRPGSSAP
jgi:hypothetical protein